jgi:hypothetical protein
MITANRPDDMAATTGKLSQTTLPNVWLASKSDEKNTTIGSAHRSAPTEK